MKPKRYDLEQRLIDFGVQMIMISETIDLKREAGRHLSGQLLRSGTSPGIHYGEAQAAESRRDFIHKMKVILKELRETKRNLVMTSKARLHNSPNHIREGIAECNELIAIFVKSIQTAEKNQRKPTNR
jgi:four helix bundle protein